MPEFSASSNVPAYQTGMAQSPSGQTPIGDSVAAGQPPAGRTRTPAAQRQSVPLAWPPPPGDQGAPAGSPATAATEPPDFWSRPPDAAGQASAQAPWRTPRQDSPHDPPAGPSRDPLQTPPRGPLHRPATPYPAGDPYQAADRYPSSDPYPSAERYPRTEPYEPYEQAERFAPAVQHPPADPYPQVERYPAGEPYSSTEPYPATGQYDPVDRYQQAEHYRQAEQYAPAEQYPPADRRQPFQLLQPSQPARRSPGAPAPQTAPPVRPAPAAQPMPTAPPMPAARPAPAVQPAAQPTAQPVQPLQFPGAAQAAPVTQAGQFQQSPLLAEPEPAAGPRAADPWPKVCDRFSLRTLYLTERLRPALDELEQSEEDPDRLQQLYRVDHAITLIRRAARDLLILAESAGSQSDDLGHPMPIVEVIRQAQSGIEHYERVSIGNVAEFAVVDYATEDLASLVAALLDNATTYSPASVTVSAHLTGDGSVMIRIDDLGIGMSPEHVAAVNSALAGPVPPVDEQTGTQSGFPVVHRLAARLGVRVNLASRTDVPGGARAGSPTGTITMVAVPPQLLCEIPKQRLAPAPPPSGASGMEEPNTGVSGPSRTPASTGPGRSARRSAAAGVAGHSVPGTNDGLPRRQRISLRDQSAPAAPSSMASLLAPTAGPALDSKLSDLDLSRSFADDLTAFTAGTEAAAVNLTGDDGAGDDGADPPTARSGSTDDDSWEGQGPG